MKKLSLSSLWAGRECYYAFPPGKDDWTGRVNLPGEPTEEAKPGDRQGGLKWARNIFLWRS